jgi:hypothetical protein
MIRTAAAPWIVSPPVVSFSAVCSVARTPRLCLLLLPLAGAMMF